MNKLKKLKLVLTVIALVLASLYLTFLIDTYTLNTWLKRAFIFCYFLAICSVIFYFYNKSDNKNKYTLIPILSAFVIVIIGQNTFLPTKSEHTFYVQAIESLNSEEKFKEAWLVDLTVDGESKKLSNLRNVDTVGWSYSGKDDNYFFAPSENNEQNILAFTVVGEELVLRFAANTWSGKVRIFDDDGYEKILSLYSEDIGIDSLEHTLNIKREYSVFERIIFNIGAIIVICFALKTLFKLIAHFDNKKNDSSHIANLNVFIIYFLLILFLLEILEREYAYIPEKITLIIGFFVLLLIFPYSSRVLPMFKKLKIAEILLLLAVAFIIAFQTVAEIIFMPLYKTTISFIDILTFVITMAIVAVPILEITLFIDKRTQNRFGGGEKIEKE